MSHPMIFVPHPKAHRHKVKHVYSKQYCEWHTFACSSINSCGSWTTNGSTSALCSRASIMWTSRCLHCCSSSPELNQPSSRLSKDTLSFSLLHRIITCIYTDMLEVPSYCYDCMTDLIASTSKSAQLVGCVAQWAERRSLAGELTVLRSACSRRVTIMWVNRLLQVSQLGQLSLSSFWGR